MQFNKYIFLIIAILGLAGCSQNKSQVTNDSNSIIVQKDILKANAHFNKADGITYYLDKPLTGTVVSYYPNGNLAEKIKLKNGIRSGLREMWFEDGQKSFEASYDNGKKHGASSTWWKNGNLRSLLRFSEGVGEGKQHYYYVTGNKFRALNLIAGKENGMQHSWRENGKLYDNYEAINGRIFGLKKAGLCFELEDENVQYSEG